MRFGAISDLIAHAGRQGESASVLERNIEESGEQRITLGCRFGVAVDAVIDFAQKFPDVGPVNDFVAELGESGLSQHHDCGKAELHAELSLQTGLTTFRVGSESYEL